jgi:hypothetical protein
MWVTLSLVMVVIVLPAAAALGVSGYRKTDGALKSLATAFKFD